MSSAEQFKFGEAMAFVEENPNTVLYVHGVEGVQGITHTGSQFAVIDSHGNQTQNPTLFAKLATPGVVITDTPNGATLGSDWDDILSGFGQYSVQVRKLVSKLMGEISTCKAELAIN